ncbi:MAG: hypothetical protein LUH47_02940, partial [Clostridiales bacterium]|nr:hypothetical protein [Clostridiales bacterium]
FMFIFIETLNIDVNIYKIIIKIAPLTMGIYIVHPLIIKTINYFLTAETPAASIISFFAVLVSSTAATWIISKIPGIKYLIKL